MGNDATRSMDEVEETQGGLARAQSTYQRRALGVVSQSSIGLHLRPPLLLVARALSLSPKSHVCWCGTDSEVFKQLGVSSKGSEALVLPSLYPAVWVAHMLWDRMRWWRLLRPTAALADLSCCAHLVCHVIGVAVLASCRPRRSASNNIAAAVVLVVSPIHPVWATLITTRHLQSLSPLNFSGGSTRAGV